MNIQGQALRIPKNTHAALRRMRFTDRPRVLWIDAICINQEDVIERGRQVALMGSIYSCSHGNLVHLSDDEQISDRIYTLVEALDKDARNATRNYETFTQTIWRADTDDYVQYRRDSLQQLDFDALNCLILLPWFRRLWVLQEAYMAPSNTCYLGSRRLPLCTILRSLRWAYYAQCFNLAADLGANEATAIKGFNCICQMYDMMCRERDVRLDGLRLLAIASDFEKTDPKDAVYALLGVANGAFGRLTPDYTTPLGSILQDATRAVLQQENTLRLLHVLDRYEDDLVDQQVASWAFRADRQLKVESCSFTLPFGSWDASAGFDEPSTLRGQHQDTAVLILEGTRVGKVAATTRRYDDWSPETMEQWFLDSIPVMEAATKKLDLSHTGAGYATCVLDTNSTGEEPTREDMELAGSWFQELIRADQTAPEIEGGNAKWEADAFDAMVQRFDFNRVRHRRMLATSSGRIGLGPGAMQTGDTVTVLRGSPVPLILRPHGAEYKFVGAARIHGIMNGEAVAEHRAEGGKEEIFLVR